MSAAGRPSESAPGASPSDVAAACRDAGLVRFVAAADGDALAATGLLARALAAAEIPFQASVERFPESVRSDRPGRSPDGTNSPATSNTDADVTVTVGLPGGDVALTADPLSVTAYAAAGELGGAGGSSESSEPSKPKGSSGSKGSNEASESNDDPDPVLALAGMVAGGFAPGDESMGLLEAAESRGVVRRPGLAIPTADLADGLAHTTLAHADFSGDLDTARTTLTDLELPADPAADDEAAHRRAASLLALTTAREGTPRAAETVARAVHPYACPDGPFATVGGYADVLSAVARERPGTGIALALGGEGVGRPDEHGGRDTPDSRLRDAALDAWRTHARRAHTVVRDADFARYDGVVVVRITEGSIATVARLLRDFRSPEPVVLVVRGREVAAAAVERDISTPLRAAVEAVGGAAVGRGSAGYARLERGPDADDGAFVAAFREALS